MVKKSGARNELSPDYASRWDRVRNALIDSKLDGLYVTAGADFTWLAGVSPFEGGWPIWLSALIFPAQAEPSMVISAMHAEVVPLERSPVKHVFTYEDGELPSRALRAAISKSQLADSARLGAADSMWYADYKLLNELMPDVKLLSSRPVISSTRSIKDPYELHLLRQSGTAVDAIYAAARANIREGASQTQVGLDLITASLLAGSSDPTVGGHFIRYTDRVFRKGDVVDVDTGARFDGYSVDTARVVFVGAPKAELRAQYEAVVAAYHASFELVKPGVSVAAVHKACEDVIASIGKRQSWKVGHGVGLAKGHEDPLLQPGDPTIIQENMVFTIDPGFFIAPGVPLHIEDTVVVTRDGCEPLNRFTAELVVV